MAKKTIAFFELEPWEKDYIQKKLKNVNLKFYNGALNEKKVKNIKNADGIATFIFSKINSKVLHSIKGLKFITTMSTGFDHIDIAECEKQNVKVSNVPSYGANTVAEHGFAMLLALSRKLLLAWTAAKTAKVNYPKLRGFDLRGRTLGVLGSGKIGQHMIRMAKGFEMNVIAWDAFPNKKIAKELGFKYVKSVNEVLKKSDVISLHLPLLDSTKHIINMKNIKLIKKGAILINTARGGLVETKALLCALRKKILIGAGIDVLEEECALKDEKQLMHNLRDKKCDVALLLEEHVLMKLPNVIVTPHNAFNSVEALQRILDTTIENINGFVKGKYVNLVKVKKK